VQVRTQIVIVAVVGLGWAAGNFAVVRPVLADTSAAGREGLAVLESRVARDPDDVRDARTLSARYLDVGLPRLTVETIGAMTPAVQADGRVTLNVSRAFEQLGETQAASARINGAMGRCEAVPPELADAAGCDARTEMELAIELAAVDRMIGWNVTPLTDPDRATLAHQLALRPIRLAGQVH
jgi:hypothetical protein